MLPLRLLLAAAALTSIVHSQAAAQCDEFELPEVPKASHHMGASVAIGGNLLMFGQPNATVSAEAGANAWRRIPGGWVGAFAVAPFSDGDEFGASISVSVSGQIAIGAPKAPNSSGGTGRVAALAWDGAQASFTGTIQPPTNLGYPVEDFGRSVSISENGEWLLVGAPLTFGNAGCIFLYRLVAGSWVFQGDYFLGSNPDQFGFSVAISSNKVLAGTPKFDGPAGIDSGEAVFYDLNLTTGALTQTGTKSGLTAGAEFGTAVALDGGFATVGAPKDSSFAVDGGAIFFYVNGADAGGFGQGAGNFLGASVDIDNGNVLVGRPGKDVVDRYKLNIAGNAVDFIETFGAADATKQPGEEFGRAVAIWGEECAIGAPLYDNPSFFTDSGRVMTYESIFDSTTTINLGNSLPGVLGAPVLTITGEICAGGIYNIALTNAAPSALSAIIAGVGTINAPFNGGVLVPTPNAIVLFNTGPTGSVNLPAPWPVGLDALPLFFQWWIQDPTGQFGFTASNAIQTVPPGFGP